MPLLTIVFTDVVGSTLTKRDESLGRDNRERDRAYLEKIQTPHFNVVRECCLAHGGKEVSTIGDAFYLTFEDPVEGVRCAVEIQKRLASAPILTPLGPLQLRIGVHSGYPEPYEGGWHGADVDTAARVESAASACQILLSARTYELVRHMTDVKFRSRGEFALKGMGRIALWEADWDGRAPRRTNVQSLTEGRRKKLIFAWAGIAVLALIALDVAYRVYSNRRPPDTKRSGTATSATESRPSVVVQEFQNRGTPDQGWIANALAGMLTNELAAGGELRTISSDDVAATTSDLSLAGMITFSREVVGGPRTNLRPDYIVRGFYSASGIPPMQAIHVELKLDDTQLGQTIFSPSYDGNQTDINGLVNQIGIELRDKLMVEPLSDADAKAAQISFPRDPEAQRHYAEGLKKLRTLDAIGARDELQQAVKREPRYALAYAALAHAWEILGYDKNAGEAAKKAFEYSRGLGDRDGGLIEAQYRTLTRDWSRAIEIYRSLWGVKHDEPEYILDVAGVQIKADMGEDALKTLDELKHTGKGYSEDPRVDYAEALADEKLADVKGQHTAAAKAAREASAEGARLLEASADWQDCGALFGLGDLKAAEKACQNSSEKADMAAGRQIKARAQSVLGRVMQREGELPQALELHKSALSTAKDIDSEKDIIGALLNIAEVQSSQGNLAESQSNQQEAIDIARRIDDTQLILVFQTNQGVDLVTQGNYDEAKALFQDELVTARSVQDSTAVSDTLLNLGVVLLQAGEPAMAEKDVAESLELARKMQLRNEELSALCESGDARMARGNLSGARSSYGEGLRLSLQAGDELNAANCRLGLAKLAIETGDATNSEAQARPALDAFTKYSAIDAQCDALNTLARTFLQVGKRSDAEAQLDRATQVGVQDQVVKLSLAVTSAQLGALQGNSGRASQSLALALDQARRMRLSETQLEIRLAQVDIDPRGHGPARERELESIEREARAEGYGLLASTAARMENTSGK
ncbi:MAG TPA: tetratricopeptide repeat protein [Candidatus Acidoferrum sp.]|nr:tetratricopeptide repeat protein [Candidatus Acidoferrum sp.]